MGRWVLTDLLTINTQYEAGWVRICPQPLLRNMAWSFSARQAMVQATIVWNWNAGYIKMNNILQRNSVTMVQPSKMVRMFKIFDLATCLQNGQNVQNVRPCNIFTKCSECPKCQARQHFHKMVRMFKMLGPATFSQNVQNVQNVGPGNIFTKCPECSKCQDMQHFHKMSRMSKMSGQATFSQNVQNVQNETTDCSEISILCLKLLGKHFV